MTRGSLKASALLFGVLSLAVPATAAGQQFEILPGSKFTFLPSGEGPGIPGCNPSDFQCDFGLSGQIAVDLQGNTLTFPGAALAFSGNEAVQDNPPFSAALVTAGRVEELLAGFELSFADPSVYRPVPHFFETLEATLTDDELRITGGFDQRPVDGHGYSFDLRAVVVPEPSTLALFGLAALFLLWHPYCRRI